MEPVSEEMEEAASDTNAVSGAAEKQSTKNTTGNFRVNMNVIVRVRPLQVSLKKLGHCFFIHMYMSLYVIVAIFYRFAISKCCSCVQQTF